MHGIDILDGIELAVFVTKKHNVNTNNPNALYWIGSLCDKNNQGQYQQSKRIVPSSDQKIARFQAPLLNEEL